MKILITGGTTFVSRYTAEFFINEGHEVYVMNRGSRTQPEGAKLIKCDRLDCGDLLRNKHFDAVLDITAYTPEHIKGLLDSGASFDTYILVSSSAVYPETNPQPFSEEQNCGKNSIWGDYGINKLNAENYLRKRVPRLISFVLPTSTENMIISTVRLLFLTVQRKTAPSIAIKIINSKRHRI